MKKIIITICLIIIFFVIFFYYDIYENFNISVKKKSLNSKHIGPIIFYDYNGNNIGTYPDNNLYPDLFKKKDKKYINLSGAGKLFKINFPKGIKGYTGLIGIDGLIGDIGKIGPRGIAGTGPIGDVGPEGPEGDQGKGGECEICLDNNGIVGKRGVVGPIGPIGPGGNARKRKTGLPGPVGPIGKRGQTGIVGKRGPIGILGEQGPTGTFEQGRGLSGSDGILEPKINGDWVIINNKEYENEDVNIPNDLIIGGDIDINTQTIINDPNTELCIRTSSTPTKEEDIACIKKQDIIKLYNFNNPICTCENGSPKTGDKCTFNGSLCEKCDNGFNITKEHKNGPEKCEIKSGHYFTQNKESKICPVGYKCEPSGNKIKCTGDQYQNQTGKTSCKICNRNCGNGKYSSGSCTSTTNYSCNNCTSNCGNGKYRSGSCTNTTNYSCNNCPSGIYCDGISATRCGPSTCPVGQWLSSSCSSTTNNACSGCPGNHYCDGKNKIACGSCNSNQFHVSNCTSTKNTHCANFGAWTALSGKKIKHQGKGRKNTWAVCKNSNGDLYTLIFYGSSENIQLMAAVSGNPSIIEVRSSHNGIFQFKKGNSYSSNDDLKLDWAYDSAHSVFHKYGNNKMSLGRYTHWADNHSYHLTYRFASY